MKTMLSFRTACVSRFRELVDFVQKEERTEYVFPVILLLCLHYFMQGAILGVSDLGEVDYFSPSLLFEAIWEPEFLMLILPVSTFLFCGRKKITWAAIDESGFTRIVVFGAAAILTWYFSTYDLNQYFGHEHLFDRFFLMLLSAGIWRHPAFAVLYTWFVTVIACQFTYPVFDFEWFFVDKRFVYDVLLLFLSYIVVKIFFDLPKWIYPTLVLSLAAVMYAYAAWVKLKAGPHFGYWVLENEISALLISSNQYGWLRHVDDQLLVRIWEQLSEWDLAMSIAAIVSEGAGLLLVIRAGLAKVGLFLVMILHGMILLTTGIFFWVWILFDIMLICLLFWNPSRINEKIFGKTNRLVILVALVGGFVVFRPIAFVWFDGRAAEPYSISALSVSGERFEVTPYYFSLYDLEMGQRRFHFLNEEKTLMGTYGTTNYEIASALRKIDVDDFEMVADQFGRIRYEEARRDGFIKFLDRYLLYNKDPSIPLKVLNSVSPPHHFLVSEPSDAYMNQESLDSYKIDAQRFFFDGQLLHTFPPQTVVERNLQKEKGQ